MPRLLVIMAAALWSTGGVGVKVAHAEPLVIAGLRSAFAFAFMLIVLRVRARGSILPLLRRPLLWGAALSYATMVVCFVLAARRTTAANAIFIQYTAPIWVALLGGRLLGEKMRPRDLVSVVLCFGGMALAFGGELGGGKMEGNVLALVSSFGFAGLPLLLRLDQQKLPHADSPMVAMVLGNLLASVVALPALTMHPPEDGKTWLVIFALGTLQIGLPYVLYGLAVHKLRALESSLLATIEPVLSPVWVVMATGEVPSRLALAGGGLIVLAVVAQALRK